MTQPRIEIETRPATQSAGRHAVSWVGGLLAAWLSAALMRKGLPVPPPDVVADAGQAVVDAAPYIVDGITAAATVVGGAVAAGIGGVWRLLRGQGEK